MEKKHHIFEVPSNYALCLNRHCPQASTCLRQLAEQEISDRIEYWTVISPKHQETITESTCPYFRSSTKVLFAKGFIKILDNLPNKQMQQVISRLISRFNQRTYYRIRKGERLLSPAEQKTVLNIIKSCGATGKQEFDAYIEDYDW